MACPHDVVLLSFGPHGSCRLGRGVVPAATAVAAISSVLMSILATEELAILPSPTAAGRRRRRRRCRLLPWDEEAAAVDSFAPPAAVACSFRCHPWIPSPPHLSHNNSTTRKAGAASEDLERIVTTLRRGATSPAALLSCSLAAAETMDPVEGKDDEAKSKVTLLPPPPPSLPARPQMINGYSTCSEDVKPHFKVEDATMAEASPSSPSLPLPRPSSSSASSPSLKAEFHADVASHSSPSSSRSPSASSSSTAAVAPPAASSSSSSSSSPSSSLDGKARDAADGPGAIKLTQVATSLPPARKKKAAAANVETPPQIIDHLPVANDEALSTFTRLQDNWYANKHIGRSKGHEWGLVCECNYRPGE